MVGTAQYVGVLCAPPDCEVISNIFFFFCSVLFTFSLAIDILLLLTVYSLCFRLDRPLSFASFCFAYGLQPHTSIS